jgi:hypothetical protein
MTLSAGAFHPFALCQTAFETTQYCGHAPLVRPGEVEFGRLEIKLVARPLQVMGKLLRPKLVRDGADVFPALQSESVGRVNFRSGGVMGLVHKSIPESATSLPRLPRLIQPQDKIQHVGYAAKRAGGLRPGS